MNLRSISFIFTACSVCFLSSCSSRNDDVLKEGLYANGNRNFIRVIGDSMQLFEGHGNFFDYSIRDFRLNAFWSDCMVSDSFYDVNIHLTVKSDTLINLYSKDTCFMRQGYFVGDFSYLPISKFEYDSIQIVFDYMQDATYTLNRFEYKELQSEEFISQLSILLSELDPFYNLESTRILYGKFPRQSIPLPELIVYQDGSIVARRKIRYCPNYFNEMFLVLYKNVKRVIE